MRDAAGSQTQRCPTQRSRSHVHALAFRLRSGRVPPLRIPLAPPWLTHTCSLPALPSAGPFRNWRATVLFFYASVTGEQALKGGQLGTSIVCLPFSRQVRGLASVQAHPPAACSSSAPPAAERLRTRPLLPHARMQPS